MLKYLRLIRCKDWIKNLFIFIPAFFGKVIFSKSVIQDSLLGFVAFSFVASSIYILNDIRDIKFDKLHPQKSKRPIASGKVSKERAIYLMLVLLSVSIVLSLNLSVEFSMLLLLYLVLNIFYSLGLKNISLLDVFIIAIGFVLRVFCGAELADVSISDWLILMTFLLALFMGVGKRRDDLIIIENGGSSELRKSLSGYSMEFVNISITIMVPIIFVCYVMYSTSKEVSIYMGSHYIYLTSVFVLLGLLRYLQIIFLEKASASPTNILWKDIFIQLTIVFWIITFLIFLYL